MRSSSEFEWCAHDDDGYLKTSLFTVKWLMLWKCL